MLPWIIATAAAVCYLFIYLMILWRLACVLGPKLGAAPVVVEFRLVVCWGPPMLLVICTGCVRLKSRPVFPICFPVP